MISQHSMIHEFFEHEAGLRPEALAVIDTNGEALTYAELNIQANKFAHYLVEYACIGAGDYVVIDVAQKTLSLLVVIIGILKAGAAYVIINPQYPRNIVERIYRETESHFLIADSISDYTNSFYIEDLFEKIKHCSGTNIILENTELKAYVGYTSGTVSEPKGIVISHENLIWTYLSWQKIYNLKESDRHLQMANPAFDVFTGDWVRALSSGGCLILCPKNYLLNPALIYSAIDYYKITVAEFVPSVLRSLMEYMELSCKMLNTFRLLICGSDIWYLNEYKKISRFCGDGARIINSYGLTETTIDSTYYEWSLDDVGLRDSSIVPIGIPFPHVKLKVVKENKEEAVVGETGELYIGGKGVSKIGYLNDLKNTEKNFIIDLSSKSYFYKTGDLVQILGSGKFLFLGRNATQFNINGQRVNYLLVESILLNNKKVQSAVVIPVENSDENYLEAFLVLSSSLEQHEILNYLKRYLPSYCMPREFYEINSLVFNESGKVSRIKDQQKVVRKIPSKILFPQTQTQVIILDVWRKVLHRTIISIDDDFELISGGSLKYVAIIAEINKIFGINLCLDMGVKNIIDLSRAVDSLVQKNIAN